ncbi:hypothetical protein COO60DRAFT_445987 [Scenedesmus sp. NREL 46B-D3]|nr:hypothetical protein COO60DRAFT_445987 [Scenedesmus sp. NREL 46B-D3]
MQLASGALQLWCITLAIALACFASSFRCDGNFVPVVMNATTNPQQVVANSEISLNVSFSRLPDHQPLQASSFLVSHDRLLHCVAVGADLDTFVHRHPSQVYQPAAESPSSLFGFRHLRFTRAGRYLLACDGLLPEGRIATRTTLAATGSPAMRTPPSNNSGWTVPGVAASTIRVRSVPLNLTEQPFASFSSLLVHNTSTLHPTAAAAAETGDAHAPHLTAASAADRLCMRPLCQARKGSAACQVSLARTAGASATAARGSQ